MAATNPTFAEQMVAKLEKTLLKAAGAKTVVVDGVQVQFEDLQTQHGYWKRQVEREQSRRPVFAPITLDGGV